MAQLTIDPLKYLGNMPNFDGSTNDLQNFCDLVDRIHPLLLQFNDSAQNIFIDLIKSKFKGRPKLVMDINCEASSWSKIKEILINNFSDKKSCEELFIELRNVVFRTNCVDFYYEIMEKLRRLNNKTLITKGVGLSLNDSTQSNRRSALFFFINGVPEPMRSILVCRDPETIEEAMDIIFKAGYAYYGKEYVKPSQRNAKDEQKQESNRNRNNNRAENNFRGGQQLNSNNGSRNFQTNENNNSNNNFNNYNNRAGNNFGHTNSNNMRGNQTSSSFNHSNNSNNNRNNSQPYVNPFSRNPAPTPEPMEIAHLSAQPTNSTNVTNFRLSASTEDYHI